MKEFLKGNTGQLSSKRLAGFSCIATGLLMKIGLFASICRDWGSARIVENYDKLDGTGDTLIYTGATLLGIGMAELFKSGELEKGKKGKKNATKS